MVPYTVQQKYFKEYGLRDFEVLQFGDIPTFKNISPPSSGAKSKLRKKAAEAGGKLHGLITEKTVPIVTAGRTQNPT
jgi:hypothetical protein